MLLKATANGVAVSPFYQPIEPDDMRQTEGAWWPSRSARRSSSGSAMGRLKPRRPGARSRTPSTAVQQSACRLT